MIVGCAALRTMRQCVHCQHSMHIFWIHLNGDYTCMWCTDSDTVHLATTHIEGPGGRAAIYSEFTGELNRALKCREKKTILTTDPFTRIVTALQNN